MGLFDVFKKKQEQHATPPNASVESTLVKIIKTHGPVKARQLATMLSNDFGLEMDKTDLNPYLYKLHAERKLIVDSSYCWSVATESDDEQVLLPGLKQAREVQQDASAIPEIEYTEEQQRVINFDPTGNLLIRGQAGSGKTTVLAARAGRILSLTGKGSMLFLTYNAALSAYVRKAFKADKKTKDIDVTTYHEWARKLALKMDYPFAGWADNRWKKQVWNDIKEQVDAQCSGHRLLQWEENTVLKPWWEEEIAWLFGQGITTEEEYLAVERIGRGVYIRPTKEDRKLIWTFFSLYNQALNKERLEDYDNAGGLVIKALNSSDGVIPDSARVDHVFVDEVQDFHQTWLMALAPIPRLTLSLAGDLAQKIYKRNFTWKSVGIEIPGSRSKPLTGSHRTTKQIMEVALYLADNSDLKVSDDYIAPIIPKKNGPRVICMQCEGVRKAYSTGYKYVADNFKRIRSKTVAVALPFSRQAYGAQKGLKKHGVDAQVARGAKLGQIAKGVTITTYHQLKGLEFDHVVLMGLDDSNFPGKFLEKTADQDVVIEELTLKRLLYVAMTRAKESLILVGTHDFCRFFEDVPDTLWDQI